ncbi:MAG: hypothetical protein ORN57_02765, partial [Alphaproteobacteria bacterium]|nr:hypothetical protein [Alphaproteobacteria bacterium]
TSSRNGFFVHLHGLAVFPIPLDNLKYTSLHDDIYNYKFAADLGYGGGASIGYNFSYFFVAANYDYIHYPFTLVDDREIINHVSDVDALGKKGTVDNHLITLGGGLRAGERFGFSLGAYYGFDLMTINQLAYLPTLSLRQTHIIGQLELDYIFSDRLKLGLLARYDYGFAANNDIIYVGNTHLLGAGASCTILF